jgi:Cd2+/Zn2+-exporting ATPase
VPGATFSDWIYRALVFLVVSCPCALVISIPLGFFGGIGAASKAGILIKGSSYLEALNYVETVVFDKTGTLTKGVFQVVEVNTAPGFSEEELVKIAAHAEGYSSHPIALSVIQLYQKEIDYTKIEGYEEIAGHGLRATVFGLEVLVGNKQLMAREIIEAVHVQTEATVAHVAIGGVYAGYFIVADEVKKDAARAIAKLKELGIKNIAILTGDRRAAAHSIAGQLGLNEVYAELLPANKVEILEALAAKKSVKGKIAVVGDGINDAPILARADIGIAMGGLGSDAAIEAADVVIMNDEPSKIALAIRIAKGTKRIVMQNIFFALGVKAVFLVLGAFGEASMWEAVFADMGVALLAIFNAIRIMNTPKQKSGNL